jgi:tetratricopeptide (TPR) repeat protein
MQGLTGPALIQRVRGYGFIDVPIVILSSLLKPTDGGILTEMSVSNVIGKPLAQADLLAALEWTAIQERLPTEIRSMERRILAMLKAGRREAAQKLKVVYMAHEEVSLGEQKYIDAEFFFDQGQYPEAKLAAIESIKLLGKSSLLPLNLLGKCLLKLKDFDAALRIFEQARQISPDNLGRILDLAELHLGRNETDRALELVSKARSIDPTLERIDSVEARVHIVAHRTKKAVELIQKMDSLAEIVGYMNNHAVALAQVGKFAEAVTLYKNTLDSLPTENYGRPDRTHARLVVTYNLALCLCRQQELSTAMDVLQPLAASPDLDNSLVKKAAVLLQKINKSLESGGTLNFSTDRPGEAGDLSSKSQSFANVLLDSGGATILKPTPLGPCLAGLFKEATKPDSSQT